METNSSRANYQTGYPWRIFWLLLIAAVLGAAAVLPYVFSLFPKALSAASSSMPVPVLVAVQLMQSTIMFGAFIALGLLLARKVGIESILLRKLLYAKSAAVPRGLFLAPVVSGIVLAGLCVLVFYTVFLSRIPDWPVAAEAAVPVWERFFACFYGAINEELLARLFALSLFLWLGKKIVRSKSPDINAMLFWTANIIVSALFAAGHLPAAKLIVPITPAVITALFTINGACSLVFGYVYWKRGLEAAMLTHFSTDFALHVISPMFLKG